MGITFKTVFNRLRVINKNGRYPIHIRLTIDRKIYYINTDVKISPKHWNGKPNKWVKESFISSFYINTIIQKKLSDLDNYIFKLKSIDAPINFEILRDFYKKGGDFTIFNDFLNQYISNVKGLKYRTIQTYNTFKTHINNYNPNIKFKDVTLNFLNDFRDYMMIDLKLSGATTEKYFDVFKKIFTEAVKQGYFESTKNPFVGTDFKIKVEKAKRTHLEIEEIVKIIKLKDLNKDLEKHRDHFLFLIYSGFYYNDLKILKKIDLQNYKGGGYYISTDRFKNKNSTIIPIYKFSHAIEIIKKYDIEESDFVFPNTISEPKFNENLKTIARLAGINKNITNKVGRHSSAQMWMSKGVERQFLSKILGHTQEQTTQAYYDFSIYDIDKKIKDVQFPELDS